MSRTLRVRQSQTVLPFGVGAVLDIQGESFVATGIGDWPQKAKQRVESLRLANRLGVTGFYAAPPRPTTASTPPTLRAPRTSASRPGCSAVPAAV